MRFVKIPAGLSTAGVDPASKLRGRGAIGSQVSLIFDSQSYYGFTTVRQMKYTSQHRCDITMDGQIALYRECCFPNCKKSW